jgi:hypothetical protein
LIFRSTSSKKWGVHRWAPLYGWKVTAVLLHFLHFTGLN